MTKGLLIKKADGTVVFDSRRKTVKDFPALAPYQSGKRTITSSVIDYYGVTHNLGYVPMVKVFYDNNDGVWHDSSAQFPSFIGPSYQLMFSYADATYLWFLVAPTTNTTYNVRYFLFKNKGGA